MRQATQRGIHETMKAAVGGGAAGGAEGGARELLQSASKKMKEKADDKKRFSAVMDELLEKDIGAGVQSTGVHSEIVTFMETLENAEQIEAFGKSIAAFVLTKRDGTLNCQKATKYLENFSTLTPSERKSKCKMERLLELGWVESLENAGKETWNKTKPWLRLLKWGLIALLISLTFVPVSAIVLEWIFDTQWITELVPLILALIVMLLMALEYPLSLGLGAIWGAATFGATVQDSASRVGTIFLDIVTYILWGELILVMILARAPLSNGQAVVAIMITAIILMIMAFKWGDSEWFRNMIWIVVIVVLIFEVCSLLFYSMPLKQVPRTIEDKVMEMWHGEKIAKTSGMFIMEEENIIVGKEHYGHRVCYEPSRDKKIVLTQVQSKVGTYQILSQIGKVLFTVNVKSFEINNINRSGCLRLRNVSDNLIIWVQAEIVPK